MRSRRLVGIGLCAALALGMPAWAAEHEDDAPVRSMRDRTPHPWGTRSTVTFIGATGVTSRARMPFGDGAGRFDSASQAGGLRSP